MHENHEEILKSFEPHIQRAGYLDVYILIYFSRYTPSNSTHLFHLVCKPLIGRNFLQLGPQISPSQLQSADDLTKSPVPRVFFFQPWKEVEVAGD